MFTRKELEVKMKDGKTLVFEMLLRNNKTYTGWNLYHDGSFVGNYSDLDKVDEKIKARIKIYNNEH